MEVIHISPLDEGETRFRKSYTPSKQLGLYFRSEEDLSQADIVADLPEDQREEILAGLDPDKLLFDRNFWLRPSQLAAVDSSHQLTVCLAGRGWGKAQRLDTPLPTPTGWTTMGDVLPGDELFGDDGHPTKVIAKTPVWLGTECYEVTFSDHTSLVVSAQHLWTVQNTKNRELTLSTEQLAATYIRNEKRGDARYKIPMPNPLELKPQDLLIDPYVLGAWLGDGSRGTPSITKPEPEMWAMIESRGYVTKYYKSSGIKDTRSVWNWDGSRSIKADLRELGCIQDKHIPPQYLRGSVEQRIDLLKGLMDTDGYIDPKSGKAEFTTVIPVLRDGMSELLSTLGIKHSVNEGRAMLNGQDYGPKWRIIFHAKSDFPVFHITRKLERQQPRTGHRELFTSRKIVNVERVPSVPTACIQVDSPSSLYLAGRKMVPTHNSRVLSEAVQKYAIGNPGCRIGVVGKTAADVRDVFVMGDSGILSIASPDEAPEYKPHERRLVWQNGSSALLFSAVNPDTIRGPQFHFSVADEVSSYRNSPGAGLANAFDQLRIATRLPTPEGFNRVLVATTPKRLPIILDVMREAEERPDKVLIIRGSTFANRHLSRDYADTVTSLYAGTTLGKQELEGEILLDVDGALLQQSTIDTFRTLEHSLENQPEFWRTLPNRIVAIDPSVSASPGDECGIIVAGATAERKLHQRRAYVLEDGSFQGSPDEWAAKAVRLARKYECPIVAEANQGGELVRLVIQGKDPQIPVLLVHAKLTKQQRAEPVAAAYQRGRVHHCDVFEMLESQWTGWAPGLGLASPDRLDAATWALTSLLIQKPKGFLGAIEIAKTSVGDSIPVLDHDPYTGALATSRFGTSGLSERQILDRLRIATDIPEKDLLPPDDEDGVQFQMQLRLARRAQRIPISVHGSRYAASSKMFGPPIRHLR